MSYVSYGSERVVDPAGRRHHHHHERRVRRDRYPTEYAGESSYAVVRRPRDYGDGGEEYLRQTTVQDEYRPGRRRAESIDVRYDREGNRVVQRRAVSLERSRGYGGGGGGGGGDPYAVGAVSRYGEDPRRSATIVEQRRSRRDFDPEDDRRPRHRSASRGEQLIAGATGAGLAIAGKELWDRREGHERRRSEERNKLATAALGVAGAVAGVQAAKFYEKSRDQSPSPVRRSKTERYTSRSPSPDHRSRRKSLGEAALGALGIKELLGGSKSHSQSRSRHRRGSSPSPNGQDRIKKAAQAAITAAAVEAFRSRKEPGGLMGERGRRIAQAAIAAGGINAAADEGGDHHSKRHLAEAVLGGLASQRIIEGPRSKSRSHSRHHRRSSSQGKGLKELAAGGLAAAAGKAFLDRNRSKSRDRRSRSRHRYDSQSPSPQRRQRRHSLGGFLEKGLGALGLDEAARHADSDRRSERRSGNNNRDRGRGSSETRQRRRRSRSSSSDMSTTDEEKQRRKLRGKEFLKAGLATVATIHAAHELVESVEESKERRKALREGEISPEEAGREKAKALVKDVASLGLAALGTKGAVGSWKKMKEQRDEYHQFDKKRSERRKKRSQRSRSGAGAGSVDKENDSRSNGSYRYGSTDSWRYSVPPENAAGAGGYGYGGGGGQQRGGGPVYRDDNPYAAGLPPPPAPLPTYPDERRY